MTESVDVVDRRPIEVITHQQVHESWAYCKVSDEHHVVNVIEND